MPPVVSKLKGENKFSVAFRRILSRFVPSCLSDPPFSYCNVAQARSYFASSVSLRVMFAPVTLLDSNRRSKQRMYVKLLYRVRYGIHVLYE
jgi:hypothetical protein